MNTNKFKRTKTCGKNSPEPAEGPVERRTAGKMPEGWKTVILKDVAVVDEVSIDKKYRFNEIEYIDIASVDKGRILEIRKLSRKEAPSRAQRIVRDNDILLSTVRPNLKHFAFIENSKPNLIASTGFAVISAKKVNPRFLYYCLTTNQYTDFLSSIADSHTSTYPAFNPDILENSEIPFPPENDQRAIAKILGDLDEKIELNHRMNKTLEAMAQAVFKHWFVDFEFPNEQGKPYKSSGGKMIEADLGEIPSGWNVSKINDECETVLGGTPSTQNKEYWESGTIAWINSGKTNEFRVIEPTAYITEKAVSNSAAKLMPKGTTILAITGATLGQVSRIEIDTCANQSVIGILENDKIPSEYIYSWVNYKILKLTAHQTGGAQQHINKNNVNSLELLIPSKKVMSNFQKIAGTIFDYISNKCFESQNLSQLRNSLLPRLMSGRIRTKELKP